jgi:MFS family permease
VAANLVALVLIPWFGGLSDRFGRRPLMIIGALGAGVLSYGYLYAVSQRNVLLTVLLAILTWGGFYQVWNATFASYFQELFPSQSRVTGFALSQNIGLALTAFLPTIFAAVAPPGSAHVPLTIGTLCFGITVIGAAAAWSARETHRIPLEQLGRPDAIPVPAAEFARLRGSSR